MRRVVIVLALGAAGLVFTAMLTLGAYAIAAGDLSAPADEELRLAASGTSGHEGSSLSTTHEEQRQAALERRAQRRERIRERAKQRREHLDQVAQRADDSGGSSSSGDDRQAEDDHAASEPEPEPEHEDD